MGTFPPDELARVLAEADVVAVRALWYENNPLVVKAGVKLGIPVLASRIGCLPEWITDGVNGWLAEPGDPRSWADALRRASKEFARMAGGGPRVKSMDEHAAETFRIYESLGERVRA